MKPESGCQNVDCVISDRLIGSVQHIYDVRVRARGEIINHVRDGRQQTMARLLSMKLVCVFI
jgi:hypothetical protein